MSTYLTEYPLLKKSLAQSLERSTKAAWAWMTIYNPAAICATQLQAFDLRRPAMNHELTFTFVGCF